MTSAVIDIGTNTVLLLVATFDPRGTMRVLADEQRSPRLGKGVDAARRIHPESIDRVLDVLSEYKSIMGTYPVDSLVVAATSAARDAENSDELRQKIFYRTGFDLEVLSGEEEALWTFRGALSGFPELDRATVVDIGGGSTELSIGTRTDISHRVSLNIGSVRLYERFLKANPPGPGQLKEAEEFVRGVLSLHTIDCAHSTLVAVAGTATSLALLDQGLTEFDRNAVAGYLLTRSHIADHLLHLASLSSAEISRLSRVMHGREDIITAGTLLLLTIMDTLGFAEARVSERGIRFGLAIREWERWEGNRKNRTQDRADS